MRIIKEGYLPEEKLYNKECYHCHTFFEFKRKEAKYSSDFRGEAWLTVNCPFCSQVQTLAIN